MISERATPQAGCGSCPAFSGQVSQPLTSALLCPAYTRQCQVFRATGNRPLPSFPPHRLQDPAPNNTLNILVPFNFPALQKCQRPALSRPSFPNTVETYWTKITVRFTVPASLHGLRNHKSAPTLDGHHSFNRLFRISLAKAFYVHTGCRSEMDKCSCFLNPAPLFVILNNTISNDAYFQRLLYPQASQHICWSPVHTGTKSHQAVALPRGAAKSLHSTLCSWYNGGASSGNPAVFSWLSEVLFPPPGHCLLSAVTFGSNSSPLRTRTPMLLLTAPNTNPCTAAKTPVR